MYQLYDQIAGGGLIAYSFQLKEPNIKMTRFDKQALMQI
ncbi:hypothetical protein BTN49_1181 [Candidatus Enterovibrio escicola]|uniref:Uncharacterized protein n=1 Tax=Candidatus Enterovibrio escicola TaxID=1927127 RepID=A0A2A5T4W0_9GAMM|nr:hypothetical protein BTN49_1181 [Candidatus Enterovibrio escacola]